MSGGAVLHRSLAPFKLPLTAERCGADGGGVRDFGNEGNTGPQAVKADIGVRVDSIKYFELLGFEDNAIRI